MRLLGANCTVVLVIRTLAGHLRLCERLGVGIGVHDHAAVACHVHFLAATNWRVDPDPSAMAATLGARRESGGEPIDGLAPVRGALVCRDHDKVFGLDLGDVALVGNGPACTLDLAHLGWDAEVGVECHSVQRRVMVAAPRGLRLAVAALPKNLAARGDLEVLAVG